MNALRPLLFLSLVSLSVLATCGGGSKEDPVALCKQGCNKAVDLCASDLGGLDPASFKTFCEATCTSSMGSGKQCKNESAIIAAYKPCLSKSTCDDFTTCTDNIPDCDTGGATGTGGSSGTGTGGSSGTGTGGRSGTGTGGASGGGTGGAGGAAGASCSALMACCNATTDAILKTVCSTYYTQVAAAGEDACAQALTTVKAQGACP